MLTKKYSSEIKAQGNDAMRYLFGSINDEKSILFVLDNIGRLPNGFDDCWIQE